MPFEKSSARVTRLGDPRGSPVACLCELKSANDVFQDLDDLASVASKTDDALGHAGIEIRGRVLSLVDGTQHRHPQSAIARCATTSCRSSLRDL